MDPQSFPDAIRGQGEAGEKLAAFLAEERADPDIVIAMLPSGIEIGKKVAESVNTPLDVLVAKSISAPGRELMDIGAVTSDGTLWLEDDLVEDMRVENGYIENKMNVKREAARKEMESYRTGNPELKGKDVLIVDQELNTGFKVIAAAGRTLKNGASSVTVGVPLAAWHTITKLERIIDRTYRLETPRYVNSVEDCCGSLETVSHSEVVERLERV